MRCVLRDSERSAMAKKQAKKGKGSAAKNAGVCIHGAAGDLCADRLGEYSMTPSDMIEALPYVMKPMIGR